MRQRRSLELVKDYDCEIFFHPRKANKVVDTLSRKSCAILTSLMEIIPILRREIQEFGIEYLTRQLSSMTLVPRAFDNIQHK